MQLYSMDTQKIFNTKSLKDRANVYKLLGKTLFPRIQDLLYCTYFRNYDGAKTSFEKAQKLLGVGKLTESKKTDIENELKQSISEVSGECTNQPVALVKKEQFKIWHPHKQFPNMTESIQIQYKEDVGRHGVAIQDIAPGEVLLIEDPLSWTVSVGQFENICQFCMKNVGRTPVPCPTHDTGVFCSFTCLQKFQSTFKFDDMSLLELFSTGASESSASAMLAYR